MSMHQGRNSRLPAARHYLPAEQKCNREEQAEGDTHGGTYGNPNFVIGSAMGILKGEQFGKDILMKPWMAVADNKKVAAPTENATNVVAEEKKDVTITANDNSAARSTRGSTSGNPNVLVGRQGALSTAEQNQGGERAEKTADVTAAEAQPAVSQLAKLRIKA